MPHLSKDTLLLRYSQKLNSKLRDRSVSVYNDVFLNQQRLFCKQVQLRSSSLVQQGSQYLVLSVLSTGSSCQTQQKSNMP